MQISIELSDIDILAARQEKIILKIEEFKKQLDSIKTGMLNDHKAVVIVDSTRINMKNLKDELIVNVNPASIPYSILGLKKLWSGRLDINVQFYTHSTIIQLPEKAREFENKIKDLSSTSNLPALKLIVIWKNSKCLNVFSFYLCF